MNRVLRRLVLGYSVRNRRRKAAVILRFAADVGARDVLFVGCSPGTNRNEGIVERALAETLTVRGACDVLMSDVPWPFVLADGRVMPFRDDACDLVLANAVVEHVGDEVDQRAFVLEQTRVGRSWVITTPNRWFPVESHTSTLFVHWSRRWRSERPEFTRLLSLREFRDLLPAGTVVVGRPWSTTFVAMYDGRRTTAETTAV